MSLFFARHKHHIYMSFMSCFPTNHSNNLSCFAEPLLVGFFHTFFHWDWMFRWYQSFASFRACKESAEVHKHGVHYMHKSSDGGFLLLVWITTSLTFHRFMYHNLIISASIYCVLIGQHLTQTFVTRCDANGPMKVTVDEWSTVSEFIRPRDDFTTQKNYGKNICRHLPPIQLYGVLVAFF